MDIVIIDDESNAREIMRLLLHRIDPEINIIGEAASVRESVLLLQGLEFDILLLDVEMMDGTGFHVLEQYPDLAASVIFTTAYNNYALEALKKNAIDYLSKPIDLGELRTAISKCERTKRKEGGYGALIDSMRKEIYGRRIPVNSTNTIDFINSRDIVYCQAEGSYSVFVLVSGERLTCSKPLKYFEELLVGEDFFRINKSQLINLKAISQYRKNIGFGQLTMANGDMIEVSRRKKAEFNGVVRGL